MLSTFGDALHHFTRTKFIGAQARVSILFRPKFLRYQDPFKHSSLLLSLRVSKSIKFFAAAELIVVPAMNRVKLKIE